MKTILVFAFLVSIPVGYGLKCYECASTRSWDDCANVRKVVTCDSSLDRCVKGMKEGREGDISFAVFAKGCGLSSLCDPDTSPFCKPDSGGKVKKCDINCCSGDLCNGGKLPMPSAIKRILFEVLITERKFAPRSKHNGIWVERKPNLY